MQLLWICVGGALGTCARYLVSGWALRALGPGLPYGTLLVNLVGSFALGLLMHLGFTRGLVAPPLRLALGVGVLGGFTTFSTFSYETLLLFEKGPTRLAIGYLVASLLGGLAACGLGLALGRWLASS